MNFKKKIFDQLKPKYFFLFSSGVVKPHKLMASDTVPQMLDCIKVSVQSEEPRMPFPGGGGKFLSFCNGTIFWHFSGM